MNDYEEDELRRAFRRRDPSPDFADRVIKRLEILDRGKRREKTGWFSKLAEFVQPPLLKWAGLKWKRWPAAGAVAVMLIAAGFGVHYHRENEKRRMVEIAEGELAKEKVMLAMHIASAKLNVAQRKVREMGGSEADSR